MFEIDRIPQQIRNTLFHDIINEDEVLLTAHADCDREQNRKDLYLLATKERLILFSPTPSADASSAGPYEIEEYRLEELSGFRVEELLSAGRLSAKRKENGEPILLCCFTNFCKESMLLFAKYVEKLAQGEELEIHPKDTYEYKHCPKCGLRYPDLNRRICPHCMEKGKLFLRFAGFFKKYIGYLIATLLTLLLLTAMGIITPYLSSGFFYDEVILGTGKFAGRLLFVLALVIGTRLLRLLATMINNYVTSVVAAKVMFDLKKTIFSAIERLSLSFFTGRQTGGLMTQVNEDANTLYTFFCDGVPYLIVNAVQVIALTVIVFMMNPMLALISLASVPVFLLLLRWIFRKSRLLHRKRYSGSKQMRSFLADVLSGMRVVKAFSREEAEVKRFSGYNATLAQSNKKLALFGNYAHPVAHFVLYIGTLLAWGFGGWMVITGEGNMTYGLLLTFISYIGMIYSPLEFFVHFMEQLADCTNALQRLFEIMDAQTEISEKENPEHPEDISGEVVFDHVSFSYQKGKKVIDDVSFTVPDGNILGIVGHTGAGKSTLANLLLRMYDTDEGEIRIGGYPIKDLALEVIYKNIAIVSQETYLFMGTILDNIRYARPDASFEEVVDAAKCAGAHDFIMQLPDAYHTRIGFGYQDLSGGERQRLSIARAILKNPKILILDEATAAMDTRTERRIQNALSQLIRGKTTIMIAHRLSTLRDADELVVIERGRLAEQGTHAELLNKEDGVYRHLFELQEEALRNAGISES